MRYDYGTWTGAVLLMASLAACELPVDVLIPLPDRPVRRDTLLPLIDMGRTYEYLGFAGGLYPGESNAPPPAHHAEGVARGRAVEPLNARGRPDAKGSIVLLSVGMSNTSQEFCVRDWDKPYCEPWSFAGQAARQGNLHRRLTIVNGARSGQVADTWVRADMDNYDRIRDDVLEPRGLTEAQVQVVWMKLANPNPEVSLPSPQADAYLLMEKMADAVRALHERYPNLQQVFVSSRIYGGYASVSLNPEPYAYESGFAVKWLVEAQIEEMEGKGVDARAGRLRYPGAAPWIGWGPYLWARGAKARSDGLRWRPVDFEGDGTHPAEEGEEKVGERLLDFFSTSPYTRCWFLRDRVCG